MIDHTFVAIIAEIDTMPLGFGGMVIQHIPGNFNLINGLEGYILSMYTLPGYRKNGIAGEILDRLVTKAKELGLGKIYLHASNDGFGLYKKYGFKEPDLPVLEI
jgi:ribosomal protein S18 acetylase RimI-like enzyme